MTRVLVAGFGPFPGAPKNPSADLVRALGQRRRPAFAGTRIITAVLPTTYAAVTTELPALLAKSDPDLVLFFGLAGGSRCIRIETRAVNAASVLHPDAVRAKLERRALIQDAPMELMVRAPVRKLIAAARMTGVPVRLSCDAGRYICNAGLFACLDITRRRERPRYIALVHIPPPRLRFPVRSRPRRSSPTKRALERAGEAILVALIAEARRG
jgi:pyroglutamyl-peptidase